MNDNELVEIFRPFLISELVAAGYSNIVIKSAYQSTKQGTPTAPTVFFAKISSVRYGSPKKSYQMVNGEMKYIFSQNYRTTFQLSFLMTRNAGDTKTVGDLAEETADIMSGDGMHYLLKANGIGIERIETVLNPYFTDDSDRYQASPSFDFVLTHKRSRIETVPYTTTIDTTVDRV